MAVFWGTVYIGCLAFGWWSTKIEEWLTVKRWNITCEQCRESDRRRNVWSEKETVRECRSLAIKYDTRDGWWVRVANRRHYASRQLTRYSAAAAVTSLDNRLRDKSTAQVTTQYAPRCFHPLLSYLWQYSTPVTNCRYSQHLLHALHSLMFAVPVTLDISGCTLWRAKICIIQQILLSINASFCKGRRF